MISRDAPTGTSFIDWMFNLPEKTPQFVSRAILEPTVAGAPSNAIESGLIPRGRTMVAPRLWTGWLEHLAPERWRLYRAFFQALDQAAIPFALTGSLATATYTGRWHNSNDLDIYVLPHARGSVIRITQELGLRDVDPEFPYDHGWTFRATDGSSIVEAIWAMKNHRACIDRSWLDRANRIRVEDTELNLAAPEEIIWVKLYVLHRDRSDWPDVLNYIYFLGEFIDWRHLLSRLESDWPLLAGVLAVFAWVSPERTGAVPDDVWRDLGLNRSQLTASGCDSGRPTLMCEKAWYGPRLGT
jgi:hypothetical protein